MALTAYSPIYRGMLADIDTRWSIISQSVDDRTEAERSGVGLDIKWSLARSDLEESVRQRGPVHQPRPRLRRVQRPGCEGGPGLV